MIHTIDCMLDTIKDDIMDTLKKNDKYSEFVEILEETGMANTLKANPSKYNQGN